MNKQIDWKAEKARAERLSTLELAAAIRDVQLTLNHADAMDRANGTGDQGGFYRDQASVYHRELNRRLDLRDRRAKRMPRLRRHRETPPADITTPIRCHICSRELHLRDGKAWVNHGTWAICTGSCFREFRRQRNAARLLRNEARGKRGPTTETP